MEKQVNFTAEHQAQLDKYLLKHLYKGTTFKGRVGASNLTICDVVGLSAEQLKERVSTIKSEVDRLEKTDEILRTDSEERKIKSLREDYEGLVLLTKWKYMSEQKAKLRAELKTLRKESNALIEENKTPAERIAAMKQKEAELLLSLGGEDSE